MAQDWIENTPADREEMQKKRDGMAVINGTLGAAMQKAAADAEKKRMDRENYTSEHFKQRADEAAKQKAAQDATIRKQKENSAIVYHPPLSTEPDK